MRKARIFSVGLVLAMAGSVPAAAAGPVRAADSLSGGRGHTHATYDTVPIARGTAMEAATVLVGPGTDMAFGRYTLAPGASTAWHADPSSVILVAQRGDLTLVEGERCQTRPVPQGKALVAAPGWHLLRNEGSRALEVVSAHVGLPAGAPVPYTAGPAGPACAASAGDVSVDVLARGLFPGNGTRSQRGGDGTRPLEVQPDLDITFTEYTFAPGFESGWHNHPGPAVGVVTRGQVSLFEDVEGECQVRHFQAGEAFTTYPEPAMNAKQTKSGTIIPVYTNVPKGQSYPVVGNDLHHSVPTAPPPGCR